MKRLILAISFIVLGFVVIVLMDRLLSDVPAEILLDRSGALYPYSVQNVMWIIFFLGVSELIYRWSKARQEWRELGHLYLPEDDTTLLIKSMLPPIFKKVSLTSSSDQLFLPSLIKRIISVFQTTNSVENASAVLNSSLELRSHDLDLRYSILRYIMWVIPTFGFVGTVIGIALALNFAGQPGASQDPNLLSELTSKLAVAFYTTLLALLMSAVLVLLMHIIQAFEERVLNNCGQYCLDNLVNRLYKPEESGGN